MNKILSVSLLLGAALTFAGCAGEEDDIFDQSAAERLNAASDLYSSRLEAQPNGWAMQLYPTTDNAAPFGSGYLVICDFNADHSVRVAMKNSLSNGRYVEDTSNWDVITDDGPVLTFDTHNDVIHTFAEPDVDLSSISRDHGTGTGIGGDYEFIIVDAPEDASYMMLKGKKRGTYNLFTPMEQGVDYESYLDDVNNFTASKFSSTFPNGCLLTLKDSVYHFDGAGDGLPNIYGINEDSVTRGNFNPFLITKRGVDYYIRFRDAFTLPDNATEQEFKFDSIADKFIGVNDTANSITGYYKARFIDEKLNAGRRFQINQKSEMGATVKAALDKVIYDFRARKFTFQNVTIQKGDDGYEFIINWTQNRNAHASRTYGASFTVDGNDALTLRFTGETNSGGTQLLKVVPSVQTLFETLAGSFNLTAPISNFNLSQVRFNSTTDPEEWYVVNYN